MSKPNIKFYRSQNAPANPVEGIIWFKTDDRTIKLYKNNDWETYSGIVGAEYDEENYLLTITPASGEPVVVNLGVISTLEDEVKKLEGIQDKVTTYVVNAIKTETTNREAADKTFNDILNGTKNDDGSEKTKGLVKEVEALRSEMNALGGIDGGDGIGGMIDAKIDALDKEDVAVTGQYVASVSQADGVITVTRADLPDYTKEFEDIDKAIDDVEKAIKSYKIEAVTENLGTNVKEAFKLVDEDGVQSGAQINIYKDSALQKVELVEQELQFTYLLADGSESTVGVDVSKFLAETEFANGLEVSEAGVVSVKIDPTSESFLTVGEGGIKLSGIENAISEALPEITTGTANGTIAVDGTDVSVKGLGSAAYKEDSAFETAGAAAQALTDAKTYSNNLFTWAEY